MKDNGLPIDYNVFQVTLQTQVVLVMTLQMCFVTRNWTLINFSGEFRFAINHFFLTLASFELFFQFFLLLRLPSLYFLVHFIAKELTTSPPVPLI